MFRKLLPSLLLFALISSAAYAQTVAGLATISGVVHDASGAAMPNANVVVANESKGVRRALTTNAEGVFTAPALVPAPGYVVSVESQGFAKYETQPIQLLVGQNLTLQIPMSVATSTTQVDVSASAPIVEDTKSDVSQVVGTREIMDRPTCGRPRGHRPSSQPELSTSARHSRS